jgi:hypothetical protein
MAQKDSALVVSGYNIELQGDACRKSSAPDWELAGWHHRDRMPRLIVFESGDEARPRRENRHAWFPGRPEVVGGDFRRPRGCFRHALRSICRWAWRLCETPFAVGDETAFADAF